MDSSERELVDRARAGDAEAYAELVRRHAPRVRRLAYHLVRGHADAEDIAQETFARAFHALARFDARSEFFTWLYRIVVNLALNRSRALSVRRSIPIDEAVLDSAMAVLDTGDSSNHLEQRRVLAAVLEELDRLPDSLRTTLIMVCVEDLPQEQVASVAGCSVGTVAWRVHEARRRLREALSVRGLESAMDGLVGRNRRRPARSSSRGDA